MHPRYENSTIAQIWSAPNMYSRWLMIEKTWFSKTQGKAACHALEQHLMSRGFIYARPDEWRATPVLMEFIAAEERVTRHEVVAFVNVICRSLESANRHDLSGAFHRSLTSSDLVDTATALNLADSMKLIHGACSVLSAELVCRITATKGVQCVGRTHGQAAVLTTYADRFETYFCTLQWALEQITPSCTAKFGGPVGAGLDGGEEVLLALGVPVSKTVALMGRQCSNRLLHQSFFSRLLTLALAQDQIVTDLRLLAIEEVGEVSEGFADGQAGSSCMPHKRNPITLEKCSGMVRILKGMNASITDNTNLWLERDISHSCVERTLFPDFFHTLYHLTHSLTGVIRDLQFNSARVAANIVAVEAKLLSYNKLMKATETEGRTSAYTKLNT